MGFPIVGAIGKKIFGTRNERMVKRLLRIVEQVSAREDDTRKLTDAQLRAKTEEFSQRIKNGEKSTDMIPEVFAVAREAMDRNVGIRNIFNPNEHFDPSKLRTEALRLYQQVKEEIEKTPARPPEGDLLGHAGEVPSWMFVDIPVDLYEAVRELYPQSKPPFRARPFDVQIIGAMVLYEGRIAEMKTGEGKTIVAPLSCLLSVLEGKQVHVVTVNDYLVQRDRDWTFPFFRSLGLTVGCIHPYHMQPSSEKQKAYQCNVVYGTTAEFGFDYLRDNMKLSVQDQVQKHRDIAIVDEVDSILIDEARTPLIISGPAHEHSPRYAVADKLARHLQEKQKEWNTADQRVQSCKVEISGLEGDIRNARDKEKVPAMHERMKEARARLPKLEHDRDKFTQYYEVEMDKKRATITHEGITEAQRAAGLGSFYVGDNVDLPHLLEQAIRAHSVYQRDRDYVVSPDEDGTQSIVIVDQNTGRKMVGRQWSDGLHQAVEAKESVPIKQETQTMATITIQNFFKLYKRLAGMTGTADTEATEFYEIYKLDVIAIPTNLPMIRHDRNDLVFIAVKDKWEAIVDEIKAFHDVGRPVLVGTTSVEKSEMLSQMLTRKHNIKHEVLNAKQHDREAEIILSAGQLGAVMISTNMAGRGTDIKLGAFTPELLIDHWKRRSICPREVTPDMPEDKIAAAVYRQLAVKELGLSKGDAQNMSDDDIRLALLRQWASEHAWGAAGKVDSMNEQQLLKALDQAGSFLLHRLRLFTNIEDMGGLHVIGTERHESRRIDNQLRGRSGRQGDQGSSRFFLSLEDDLMKMFAGPTTLRVLSRLGMKEGDAIEHPMLTKSVGRAQRKVEERNFLIRKNILEYDEVMDHQRHAFYDTRQAILEGRRVKELIFEHIDDAARDAVETYLDKNYVAKCIAEWVRGNLAAAIEPDRLRGKDRDQLHRMLVTDAKEEACNMIRVTIGEYLPGDIEFGKGKIVEADEADWDYKGLADWANAAFKANVTAGEIEKLSKNEIIQRLDEAAMRQVDAADLGPLDQFLVTNYGAVKLAEWAANKFACEIKAEELAEYEKIEDAAEALMQKARETYARREIVYPIEFALQLTTAGMQQDPQQAIEQLCAWVKSRYELDWRPAALPSANPSELRTILIEQAEKWDESRISERAERAMAGGSSPDQLDTWIAANLGAKLTDDERQRAIDDPKTVVEEKIAATLRAELTHFERWVLLQILDQAWKDHLYAMDQLKESIGLRSFSQRDPRIEYKREGARLFEEMHMTVRDKVTDLIFKARLTPQVARPRQAAAPAAPAGSVTGTTSATQGAPPAPIRPAQPVQPAQSSIAAAAAAASGTAAQRRDLEVAERAGAQDDGDSQPHRQKKQPVRATVTVGRNEPCPCGSGKKFKQCCGKRG